MAGTIDLVRPRGPEGRRTLLKKRTIRTSSMIAAVLLVGTVAFAAAQTVQPSRSSQIPIVVTASPSTAVSETVPSDVATGVASIATPTPVVAITKAASDGDDNSGSSTRELVTPKMRDDSDVDDSGGASNGDSDNVRSGTSGSSGKGPARGITRPSHSDRKTDTGHKNSNVKQEPSSGKN